MIRHVVLLIVAGLVYVELQLFCGTMFVCSVLGIRPPRLLHPGWSGRLRRLIYVTTGV